VVILATLGAALLSYSNFGFFHMGWGHIHYWDAFHYFMGPKYLPELVTPGSTRPRWLPGASWASSERSPTSEI